MVAVGFGTTNNPFLLSFLGVSSSSYDTTPVDVVRVEVSTVAIGRVELGGEDLWEYWSDTIKDIVLVAIIS